MDLVAVAKSVDNEDPILPTHRPREYGGVAVVWNKKINHLIQPVTDGGCRIQTVTLNCPRPILIVAVYLPAKGSPDDVDSYEECFDHLYEIFEKYSDSHDIVVGGDFNEYIYSGHNSKRNRTFKTFLTEKDFIASSVGPTFINNAGMRCQKLIILSIKALIRIKLLP